MMNSTMKLPPLTLYRTACLMCLIALQGLAHAAPADEDLVLINKLNSRNFEVRTDAILKLHQKGKAAIPLLLDHVGDCEIYPPFEMGFQDHSSSKMILAQSENNCSGLVYAYTIELILAGDTLVKPDPPALGDIQVRGRHCRFHAYGFGLIVTKEEKALTPLQMVDAKKIYQDWWMKNKDKTIEQLRADWDVKMKPLSGSAYHWR